DELSAPSASTSEARGRRLSDQFLGLGAGPSVDLVEILQGARRAIFMTAHHGLDMARNVGEARAAAEEGCDEFLVGGVEASRHRAARLERLVGEAETWKARRIGLFEGQVAALDQRKRFQMGERQAIGKRE